MRDRLATPPSASGRMVWNLDWNLIRTFLVIVEQGGITAAANALRLKQPTVSNALRRLEGHLSKRLILRGPARFEVTPAGLLLYDEAIEIFGSISRLGTLIRDMDEEVSGHVTLAMASHVVSPVLDEVLSQFHQRHRLATLSIDVITSQDAIQAVRQRQASLAICLVHEKQPHLDYLRLFREYFGFYCGPRHRLFGRAGLSLSDLRGETSVSFKTDRLTDALRPVALVRAQAELEERIVGVSSNLEEVRRMILAGLGIGALPLHVARKDEQAGLLWRLPPYDDPPAIDIHIVTNPRSRLNRAEKNLIAMLRETVTRVSFQDRDYR